MRANPDKKGSWYLTCQVYTEIRDKSPASGVSSSCQPGATTTWYQALALPSPYPSRKASPGWGSAILLSIRVINKEFRA